MNNLDRISQNIRGEITNNTHLLFFKADLNDIAPYMCSPYSEEWIWADKTNPLIKYVFEVLLANYLVNDVMAFGDYNNIKNVDFDFLSAAKLYEENKTMNNERTICLSNLIGFYHNAINDELSYFDFEKLLMQIEQIAPVVGINVEFYLYSNPLATRHSKYLRNQYFDCKNYRKNY